MRTPDIEWTRIQDLVLSAEGHVFDRRTGRSYTANGTGSVILQLLQDGQPPDDIVVALSARCGQHASVVEAGVLNFLGQLGRYLR